ncbi:alpha/beta hydrolase family protein [Notoacmeibacter ruber]|uniref:Alpha/beta fold hydrolase n=1 Tax=Notoacmeibacter ruber TaxID=2670375 RepID=A0A3L7JG43_9HYPH|nr:alpha/beta fold hydrolase [Notoacmeibacter ruber]RLQ88581.1 alpha/beta fold hydrolase [Notoacmeibacter ruber]
MRTFIAATLALIMTNAASADPVAGYDRLDVRVSHRAYPVGASVWYPAGRETYVIKIGDNPIFKGTPAYVGAAVAEGRFPLILFSHGSGGNMDNAAWLSSALAAKGAMVLAVNHPGSTSGDSSPRRSVHLDERASDLSGALDALLADPAFAPHIDRSRIVAVGFSLGGATALNLAGLRYQKAPEHPYCEGTANRDDCIFFANGGIDFTDLPDGFSADMRDERVTGAVAIDPAFTEIADRRSVDEMQLPIALINLGDEHRLAPVDVSENGSDLVHRLPDATYSVLAPAVHFTFLAPCKDAGAELLAADDDDPVCDDPAGTDREKVHRQIAEKIAHFVGL